ncbi:MAG: AAA family ATPase [Phycisphaerales bacterium]|nr:AAA family ATPase [Phycisphaerales bacterium]
MISTATNPDHARPVDLLTIPRRRPRTRAASQTAHRAAAALGVTLADLRPHNAPPPVGINIAPGATTLITGHSGSGKSSILHDIARTLRAHGWRVVQPSTRPFPERPCTDLFPGDPTRAMRHLARAGLGDARCFIRPPSTLSLGEQTRLRLARTMHRAEHLARRGHRVVVLLDELGTTLDTLTARAVAALLRRFANAHPDLVVVAATSRDDLFADLAPDAHIHLGPSMPHRPARPLLDDITIEPGDRADYLGLALHHYRPGLPATIVHTLVAWHRNTGTAAGVLTVSMPTRNGAWRTAAWPDLTITSLHHLNAEVRTISRVIVEPRFRGLGLARRLVRTYLTDPLTTRTEAVAAMGRACPFFEHAGMIPVIRPTSPRHQRLRTALDIASIPTWQLVNETDTLRRIQRSSHRGLLEDALRRWANDSGATRRFAHGPLIDILHAAAPAITAAPVAYVHQQRREVAA